MQCHLTVDDVIHYVKYNDEILTIFGNISVVSSIKSITFESYNDDPGNLEIKGQDKWPSGYPDCESGGLLLHCRANDTMSPWHNFKSDNSSDWLDEFNSTPCKSSKGMLNAASYFAYFFKNLNVKKIWADRKTVTLIASPKPGNASSL